MAAARRRWIDRAQLAVLMHSLIGARQVEKQ
jgi:hypothetical protein